MARSLVQEPTDEQILGLIEEWVELLARDRYEDAFGLIPASAPWTPALLKELVERGGQASPVDGEGGLWVTSPLSTRRAGYARREQVSVPMPERGVLQQLIAEQFTQRGR